MCYYSKIYILKTMNEAKQFLEVLESTAHKTGLVKEIALKSSSDKDSEVKQ